MNTVEWAIRDGVPYAIDFMNPAPDMDINSTGYDYHRWCVERMADLCIRLAKEPSRQAAEMRWTACSRSRKEIRSAPSYAPQDDMRSEIGTMIRTQRGDRFLSLSAGC